MKKYKKFIAMVIGFSFLIPNCAFAATETIPAVVASEDVSVARANDWEYKRVKVSSHKVMEKYIGLATGQNKNGTVFGTPGGFYYSETGGNDIRISVTASYGPITIGVDPGTVKESGGICVSSPYVGKACWLHVWKDITTVDYDVYRRIAGTNQSWKLCGNENKVEVGKSYYAVYDTKSEPKTKP